MPINLKPVTILAEVPTNPKPDPKQTKQRPYWQQYLIIMGIDILIVFVGSLLLGNIRQMTNLFSWSTFLLLIVAVVPIIFEVGTSAKVAGGD